MDVMPAPKHLHTAVAASLRDALAPLLDQVWDASAAATRADMVRLLGGHTEPPGDILPGLSKELVSGDIAQLMSPQKRGAVNRAARGAVKQVVGMLIQDSPDGISREKIRQRAAFVNEGRFVLKEGSLKQALRLLRESGKIENRGRKWYPT